MDWIKRNLLLVVLAVVGAGWAYPCYQDGKDTERRKQEAAQYKRESDSLRVAITGVLAKVDTLRDTVRVQRTRLVHDSVRVETVRTEFLADTTVRDSLSTALHVIQVQDSALTGLRSHVRTLTDLTHADSSAMALFVIQRRQDSTRIHVLERQARGFTILGLRVPHVRCGPGVSVVVYPKVAAGPAVSCTLGF